MHCRVGIGGDKMRGISEGVGWPEVAQQKKRDRMTQMVVVMMSTSAS